MYSYLRSRAGLVAFFLILIISLVSAAPVPIPAPQSEFSSTLSPRHAYPDGRDLIQRETGRIVQTPPNRPSTQIHPTLRLSTITGDTPIGADNQLVRRSKITNAIKHAFQKVGNGIKSFVKNTAGKVAKFGLKVVSTVQSVAAKAIGFIPGLKPVGKAIEAASKVTGFISDKIHANLGAKLQKGMNVMNKADKVMKYIPRRRDLSEEGNFQRRDTYYLGERDIYERAFDDYLDWE